MRFTYSQRKMDKLFANSGDPDQMPHSAASDLGLYCLPNTLFGVSQLNGLKAVAINTIHSFFFEKKHLKQYPFYFFEKKHLI